LRGIVATILSVVFPAVLFSALTVWVSWEGEEFFYKVAREFERLTGIEVEVLYVPRIDTKLQLSLRTGHLPDICLVQDVSTGIIAASGRAVPLDPEFLASLGYFSEDALSVFSSNGKYLAVPFYADLQVGFLNRSLVKPDAPSQLMSGYTIEDLKKLPRVKDDKDVISVAWDFMSPYVFFSFLAGYGEVTDSRGMPAFSSDTYASAVSEVRELFASGTVLRLERQAMVSRFLAGKLIFMLQGSFLAPEFERAGIDFQILPFPRVGDKSIPSVIDSKGFVIFDEKSLEPVRLFLSFLFEESMDFATSNYKIPLWVQELPVELVDLERVMENVVRMPSDMRFQQIYGEAMRTVLQVVYVQAMSIDDALKSAQAFAESNW